ncbi:MAG: hypothetical protein KC613_01930 [Myxococcales bacterium]|nr:hypothetical protein [Myxococcales bacterium]
MLHVGFTPAAERAGIYRGLLGDFDGDPANDLRLADGSALAVDPLAGELLYGPFRAAWRAVDHGRLFEDRPGEGPGAFDRDDFPGELANLQGFDDEARALARAVCVDAGVRDEDRRLDECTLDVVCTGDPAAARPFVDQGAPALAPPVEGAPPGPDPSVEGCVAEGRHRVNAQRPQGWHDCPADCFEAEPSIWGTDVYTDDSKICAAAIHAGRLPADQAGRVYLEHRPGQDAYEGSVRNGVTSRAYGHWGDSFGFVDGP